MVFLQHLAILTLILRIKATTFERNQQNTTKIFPLRHNFKVLKTLKRCNFSVLYSLNYKKGKLKVPVVVLCLIGVQKTKMKSKRKNVKKMKRNVTFKKCKQTATEKTL